MDRNLGWKSILIVVLVLAAVWLLSPPTKTLKPGLDLAGGTSLIYEIDTQGLTKAERSDLSIKMINILRRRIDPVNIQNLVWRPQGNTRFEIQVPLASLQARQKRHEYQQALNRLLEQNVSPSAVLRSLEKPQEERAVAFEKFAGGSEDKLTILNTLATAYDELTSRQKQANELEDQLNTLQEKISQAGLDLNLIKSSAPNWSKLDHDKLRETVKEFLKSEDNMDLVVNYVNNYAQWSQVVNQINDVDTGRYVLYRSALKDLDKLSMTEDQLNSIFEMAPDSSKRKQAIENLKEEFPDRAEMLGQLVKAADEYRPYRGRLDDPEDLRRMLKGAGILEFRILPTRDHAELSTDEIDSYVERLTTKGPKFASDNKCVWCEIEKPDEWKAGSEILGQFGGKEYVLTSNKSDEVMLHTGDTGQWKLTGARPTQDRQGRRAIGFSLDVKGGTIFGKITGNNIGRPLCILLDGMAISAPNIQSRITTQGIITGSFSQKEQDDMVNKLNAGSLPARLIEQPLSVKTIGPSIGADNRDKGIYAGFVGFAAVVLVMLVYYTLAGSIADIALVMNLLFILAIMALVRATFTLPGIAGIILTIGISVDANVLIFERIREEQQRGASLRIAITNGYQRAFSTIFDANLTTFITAAILFWVASEEVKGFAIVLMLGIASSMFTALFVTRVMLDLLLNRRLIKDHLLMLQVVKRPNINWMKLRPLFFSLSALLIIAGMAVFFTRDDSVNNRYDIEFTGGTNMLITLKKDHDLSRQDVENRIYAIGNRLQNPGLQAANVYRVGEKGNQYEINTTETNKTTATVTFPQPATQTVQSVTLALKGELRNLGVVQDPNNPAAFIVSTSQANVSAVRETLGSTFENAQVSEPVVDEVVNNAIREAFADDLAIQQNLEPKIVAEEKITEKLITPYPELADFMGGLKLTCQLQNDATHEEIDQRIKDLKFKPEARDLQWYSYKILGLDLNELEPNTPVKSFAFVSAAPEAGFRELPEEEWAAFVQNERTRVLTACELEGSLPRVTQIDPSIGAEAKTRAMVAIALSLFAIVTYIWVRFGNVRYGVAAIIALIHDVCITLGAVTACHYLAGTRIGEILLIGDFKINLTMIAAFLTLIGYSLNDTIVVFDRIRENRHKAQVDPRIVNDSINQTLGRTLMTSFTTFIVVLVMYIFGGEALRGFTFAIGFGVIIGTYSSMAIAVPILLIGAKTNAEQKKK